MYLCRYDHLKNKFLLFKTDVLNNKKEKKGKNLFLFESVAVCYYVIFRYAPEEGPVNLLAEAD